MSFNNVEQVKDFILEISEDFELETNVDDVEDVCKIYDILEFYNEEYIRCSGVPMYKKALDDLILYMEYLEEENYKATHIQA